MSINEFVYSRAPVPRMLRHISFWLGWLVLIAVTCLNGVRHVGEQGVVRILHGHVLIAAISVSSIVPFCYFVVNYVVPDYLFRRKYLPGTLLFLLAIAFQFCLFYWLNRLAAPSINLALNVKPLTHMELIELPLKLLFGIYGPLSCLCLVSAIKFYKAWHLKKIQNIALREENTRATLLLLKAQINPHFLFNTLNNIYAYTLTCAPEATGLIYRLRNIFTHMTEEGEQERIPLAREIDLIRHYIALEKVRYDRRLNLQVKINGSPEGKYIAPLLFIPLIENSFKHGCSKTLGESTLKLTMTIDDRQVLFELLNSKPPDTPIPGNHANGIGLSNLRRRLELIYPNNHRFDIDTSADFFSVSLRLTIRCDMPRPTVHEYPAALKAYIGEVVT